MACPACQTNPVVSSDYKPQGDFITLADLKTYTVGPDTATRAIVCVYDIFAFHPSSQQGADRIAATLKDTKVFMPDFFKGESAKLEWIPPDTDQKKAEFGEFMSTTANFANHVPVVYNIAKAINAQYPSVKVIGAYGLCWGGKILALTPGKDTPFKATAQAHPAAPDVKDLQDLSIPHCALLTKEDGTPEALQAYEEELKKKPENYVEMYGDMIHGFMGARADLKVERNSDEYKRGYNKIIEFISTHVPN